MTACSTCPSPDYCERCPTCELCVGCKCEPPIVFAEGEDWRCEACGRVIVEGERMYLYAGEDPTVVTHVECPVRAQA